jgi:SAM-dependent methyltransferase
LRADHLARLHHGGTAARWGNLGRWDEAPADFAAAGATLARTVGRAAGMTEGDAVLSLACGAGEELALWAEEFGATSVMALEADASRAAQARQRAEAIRTGCIIDVHCADARLLPQLVGGRFDRIVCVDAAYHLAPRLPLLRAARRLLNVGGGLAFTDLVIDDRDSRGRATSAWRHGALELGARLSGISRAEVLTPQASLRRLRDAGFAGEILFKRLDEAVLDGFCRFAARQAQRIGWAGRASAGWRRVALTRLLIRAGRAAGLGYALIGARV